jgi:Holliday junction resolvasome RuvABC endonuclease subunit
VTVFIAIDPANSTGVALGRVDGAHCDIFAYYFIDIDTSSPYLGDHCLNLQSRLSELYNQYKFTDVAIEDYYFSSKFVSGVSVNTAYRTAIHMWSRQHGLSYSILNISSWKTIAAGRSTPTKDQKLKWGKEQSKKFYMAEALYLRHNIRFPNHSISEETGKPILFRYDIVDAVGQAIYHAFDKYNCKTFSSSVSVPEDVLFKKTSKKHFFYHDIGINSSKEDENDAKKKKDRSRKSRPNTL